MFEVFNTLFKIEDVNLTFDTHYLKKQRKTYKRKHNKVYINIMYFVYNYFII